MVDDAEKTYGQVAYEGYAQALNGPGWDDVPEDLRVAWEASGEAVREAVIGRLAEEIEEAIEAAEEDDEGGMLQ